MCIARSGLDILVISLRFSDYWFVVKALHVLHVHACDTKNIFVLALLYGQCESVHVPHFPVHISGPEAHMKDYHTTSDRKESGDSCTNKKSSNAHAF